MHDGRAADAIEVDNPDRRTIVVDRIVGRPAPLRQPGQRRQLWRSAAAGASRSRTAAGEAQPPDMGVLARTRRRQLRIHGDRSPQAGAQRRTGARTRALRDDSAQAWTGARSAQSRTAAEPLPLSRQRRDRGFALRGRRPGQLAAGRTGICARAISGD
jgi:hypothetical protein